MGQQLAVASSVPKDDALREVSSSLIFKADSILPLFIRSVPLWNVTCASSAVSIQRLGKAAHDLKH